MVKKVVWTLGALQERKDVLDFWTYHNKSDSYSIKLNLRIERMVEYISKHPKSGRLTDVKNVRILSVSYYQIFYEENDSVIYILSIWDGRQNPEQLKARLE